MMPCDKFKCTLIGYCENIGCVKKMKDGFLICPDLNISSKVDDEKRG